MNILNLFSNGKTDSVNEESEYTALQNLCWDFPGIFARPLRDTKLFWNPSALWDYMTRRLADLRQKMSRAETDFESEKHKVLATVYHVGKVASLDRENITFSDIEALINMSQRFYDSCESLYALEDVLERLKMEGIE